MATNALRLALCALTALLCSCAGDKTINNYTTLPDATGEVAGRVSPAETDAVVTLWQATEVARVLTDSAGYFAFNGVSAGLYELRVACPSGAHRAVGNINVEARRTLLLGEIATTTLPGPLVTIQPTGTAVRVERIYSQGSIYITTEVALDLSSFSGAVTIEPTLIGTWTQGSSYDRGFTYFYTQGESFRPSTQYTITFGPSLKFADGRSWGGTHSHVFTTEGFRVIDTFWNQYSGGGLPVPPTFRGSLATLVLNSEVATESIEAGVVMTPSLGLEVSPTQSGRGLDFNFTDDVRAGTMYTVHVHSPLADVHGAVLDSTVSLTFAVEPFSLARRIFQADIDAVPLTGQERVLFSDLYNLTVDAPSAMRSVHISPICDFVVRDSYSGGYSVVVTGRLQPATEYTVTIDANLSATDGTTFGQEQTVVFRSEPIKLVTLEIANAQYGYPQPELSPGALYVRASFNVAVDPDSLGAAVSFTPPIPGVWVAVGSGSTSDLRYFTDDPLPLNPEDAYTFRIDGAIPLFEGKSLGADVLREIRVAPVQVLSHHPSSGETAVDRYTQISVLFNSNMDVATTQGAFRIRSMAGNPVAGTFVWSVPPHMLTFIPATDLEAVTLYEVVVASNARDASGHTLDRELKFRFRTGP